MLVVDCRRLDAGVAVEAVAVVAVASSCCWVWAQLAVGLRVLRSDTNWLGWAAAELQRWRFSMVVVRRIVTTAGAAVGIRKNKKIIK